MVVSGEWGEQEVKPLAVGGGLCGHRLVSVASLTSCLFLLAASRDNQVPHVNSEHTTRSGHRRSLRDLWCTRLTKWRTRQAPGPICEPSQRDWRNLTVNLSVYIYTKRGLKKQGHFSTSKKCGGRKVRNWHYVHSLPDSTEVFIVSTIITTNTDPVVVTSIRHAVMLRSMKTSSVTPEEHASENGDVTISGRQVDGSRTSKPRGSLASHGADDHLQRGCSSEGSLVDPSDQALYSAYVRHQKLDTLPAVIIDSAIFVVCNLLLDAAVFSESKIVRIVVFAFFAIVYALALTLFSCVSFGEKMTSWCGLLLWALMTLSVLFDVGTITARHTVSDVTGWTALVMFTTFLVLPWKVGWCLAASVALAVVHSLLVGVLWSRYQHRVTLLPEQLAANLLLFLGAILLGALVFAFTDRKQRRSFLEAKASLTIRVTIEKEYKEQERLLLSVLPKHVADEMIRDLGSDISGHQFRKIYMSRHENVSILFADIVGFTAISSTVSASELVKILNELFASFDTLAKKYHQHRIKILGDCYYCICGGLEPRPDHAVLSIHMGLAMVDAISAVRRKTEKDVSMRVGVHTGAVLGGVLGQRQWQFDVLGKEVTLANKMESGGLPGRVHLSEATKCRLNGEFELEPGNGGDREDYLRLLGINTYLVKAIIKPFPAGTLDAGKATKESHVSKEHKEDDIEEEEEWLQENCVTGCGVHGNTTRNGRHAKKLEQALLERAKDTELWSKAHPMTLRFHDSSREARYQRRHELETVYSMAGLCVVLALTTAAQLCVLPRSLITILALISGELILVFMTMVSMTTIFCLRLPTRIIRFAHALDDSRVARTLWGLTAVLIVILVDMAEIVQCQRPSSAKNVTEVVLDPDNPSCQYPVYFVHSGYLTLLGVTSMVHIDYIVRVPVIVICTVLFSVLYTIAYGDLFDYYDEVLSENFLDLASKDRLSIELICAAVAMVILTRKIEAISRRLYLWQEGADAQKDRASELRHKNEALVYNLLPAHVARDFIGQRKRDNDLYSNSYDEAGVMFAACPNFTDFYNESSVNNNGLECLRFLNEIISDYDELLQSPRFESIVKIKTVGSTYMAASGMVASRSSTKELRLRDRWQHLDDLVQFALSMREALKRINEQSFNNFILRIGINHGPIIAGVIGARKPHYDIWGNTVNVASRMESTGVSGKIQVVEETKEILEEFGYIFEKRGLIKVKGKGELTTYFLEGHQTVEVHMPNQVYV